MLPVSNLQIRLDQLNPGHFFACCGLFDLLSFDKPDLLAWFAVDPLQPRVAEFTIEGASSADLNRKLDQLMHSEPDFPSEIVEEASIRPAVIPLDGAPLILDWWLDEFLDKTTNLKCWAGQVTTRKLFMDLLPLLDAKSSGEDLFERACMTKAKFGVDPRSAWNALDFGFSPNEHARDSATFPAVEILAAIGLQGFRPDAGSREQVSYALWQAPLATSVARQAFRAPWDGLPHTAYQFSIAKRGQSYKYFTFANHTEESIGE